MSDERQRREQAEFEPIARRLAEANRAIEPPAHLLNRIEAAQHAEERRRWRVRFVAAPLAAAAVLALTLLGWLALRNPAPPHPAGERIAIENQPLSPPQSPASAIDEHRPIVRVALDESSPWIARPIQSTSPNVTIVLLYQQVVAAAPEDGAAPPSSQQGNTS